jgi:hypothetical protein
MEGSGVGDFQPLWRLATNTDQAAESALLWLGIRAALA